MPQKVDIRGVAPYLMPKGGVNLHKSVIDLSPDECIQSRNLYYRTGMQKRGGSNLSINTSQVVSNKKVVGLHRFYYGSTKKTVAAADTTVKVDDGANAWDLLHTFSSAENYVSMRPWGNLGKLYIANGADHPVSYDGTTVVDGGSMTITLGGVGAGEIFIITLNGTAQGTGGKVTEGVEWTQGVDADASAIALASYLNGLSGLTASAGSGATSHIVTITPTAATHVEKFAEDTVTDLSLSTHFAGPAKAIQFLEYQDRLLSIDNNNPGELRWSKSFDDSQWELRVNTSMKPDTVLYGMVIHSISNSDFGYESSVLIAGATSMYLFKGTSLIVPFNADATVASSSGQSPVSDFSLQQLGIQVGCNSPKTMCWTPAGTIWLGVDKQVYLLPFDSNTPIPIGDKIRARNDVNGIEDIPGASLTNACAIYDDGFYKLSFATATSATNNAQFWLDIARIHQDEDRLWGPWYGPMEGHDVNIYAKYNGPGDSGQLIAGESSAKGYVYGSSVDGVFSDINASTGLAKQIVVRLQTYYNPLGSFEFAKTIRRVELETYDISDYINVDFYDLDDNLSSGENIQFTGGLATNWDAQNWGTFNWANFKPERKVLDLNQGIIARRLMLDIYQSSSNTDFRLFSVLVEISERSLVFERSLNH